jgi:hypothetical protein
VIAIRGSIAVVARSCTNYFDSICKAESSLRCFPKVSCSSRDSNVTYAGMDSLGRGYVQKTQPSVVSHFMRYKLRNILQL